MPAQKKTSFIFLTSFLPALAYWFLEQYYPVKVAVAGGLILGLVEMILEKIFSKKIHTLSKFNFSLLLLLGGLAFVENEGVWFKLSPGLTSLALGVVLLVQNLRGQGMLRAMMEEMGRPLPPLELWHPLETRIALFFLAYAFLMIALALWGESGHWLFFKTVGLYLLFAVYFLGEMVNARLKAKKRAR